MFLPSAHAAAAPITLEDQTFPGNARVAGTRCSSTASACAPRSSTRSTSPACTCRRKAATGADVLAEAGPKRVQVRMLMDGPSDEFAKAFTGGITKRTPADQVAAMQDRIAAFDRTLRSVGNVKKGDVVNLDYAPAVGLTMTVNGKPSARRCRAPISTPRCWASSSATARSTRR